MDFILIISLGFANYGKFGSQGRIRWLQVAPRLNFTRSLLYRSAGRYLTGGIVVLISTNGSCSMPDPSRGCSLALKLGAG